MVAERLTEDYMEFNLDTKFNPQKRNRSSSTIKIYLLNCFFDRCPLFNTTNSDSLKKKQVIKLLIESGLIVFSVLFALFIDRMATNTETNHQKKTALARIYQEVSENEKLIRELIILHDSVIQNLNVAIGSQNDTL